MMTRSKDVNMFESLKSKLNVVWNTLHALSYKFFEIKGLFVRFYGSIRHGVI